MSFCGGSAFNCKWELCDISCFLLPACFGALRRISAFLRVGSNIRRRCKVEKMVSDITKPEYRGRGICTQLINNLVEYGRGKNLGRIDLSASEKGYPIYKKVGFVDKDHRYFDMRYEY